MESKFVKAYCEKTKQYFGLEVKKYGGSWKVVNFTWLSSDQAKLAATEVEQREFVTHDNLRACKGCRSRKVGGCSCAERGTRCGSGMKYNFQCIYCNKLKIDYSLPSAADMGGLKAGEKIMLSQGQEVKIRFSDDKPLSEIFVGVGWDPVSAGTNMDVDSSVFVMSPRGDKDIVSFMDKEHPSGCAQLFEDNLTGELTGNFNTDDDENILVKLDRVPANRDRLVFSVNIYDCDSRGQTLRDVKNFYIRLSDNKTKKPLIEYRVANAQVNPKDTAIIIGVATRKASGWTFKAIGKSVKVGDIEELAEVCDRYL